ncbi:FoF1 ATP synthase subunit gamma [Nisaea sp.]|uniref:F0F1 ATP synthase subunit gamma n=1 Tax=Nisaea sp. TaxID=2024842 RepID=UPI002B272C33|nr:FoF1 ATP synthase subunit gamma [Nisaea sp.]
MTRLAEIEAQISGMSDLQNIIAAMRSLSGMRLREAQRAVPGIRQYAEVVAGGIADTLSMVHGKPDMSEAKPGTTAIILCASEHGFVGGFNDRVVAAALNALGPQDKLFVLGSRGAARATEMNRTPAWFGPMATRPDAVSAAVQRLSEELFRQIAAREITRVEAIYAASRQGAASTVERRPLLPLDVRIPQTKQKHQAPLHNMDPAKLLEKLTEEYVFARLTEAAVESISAENAARLSATQAAHDNISTMLTTLQSDARQSRQSEITTEILELAVGAAMVGDQ